MTDVIDFASKPQFLAIGDQEIVVLLRSDYDAMIERLEWEDEQEAAWAARIIRDSDAAIARGEDISLPLAVWERMEAGEPPLKVLREWRGLEPVRVAEAAGVSASDLSAWEAGGDPGSDDAWRSLARVLAVPITVLRPD